MKINEFKRLAVENGCYLLREGANHEVWYSPITGKTFTIPRHGSQELQKGILAAMLKQAGFKIN